MPLSIQLMKAYKQRLRAEENYVPVAYDDKTGEIIKPGYTVKGNVTTGIGWNISAAGPSEASEYLRIESLADDFDKDLTAKIPCYAKLNDARKLVLLDIAYNAGIHALLEFKEMLGYMDKDDWANAANELLNSEAARNAPSRYRSLAKLLDTGELNGS